MPSDREEVDERDYEMVPGMGSFRYQARRKRCGRPSKNEPMIPFGTNLHQKYKLMEIIGAGGYGQIFKAYWSEQKIHVAVKVMTRKHEPQRMILEQIILSLLQNDKKKHFPYLFGSGTFDKYMFITMELLGRSLSDLRKRSENRRFETQTAIRVGIQVLEAIKTLHDINFVHRDIKPGNMCCGSSPSTYKNIYLVDFGLSRRYRENGKVTRRKSAGFRGTLRYVSLNVHERKDQGPCDDLISLFYSIVELSEGILPWTRLRDPDDIARRKKMSKAHDMCKQQPEELYEFYSYCYDVVEEGDRPDYAELMTYLKKILPPGASAEPMSYESILGVDTIIQGSLEQPTPDD